MDKEMLERAIKGNDMCREKYNCSECPYHGLHYCHSILCRESRDLLKEIVMCKDCKHGELMTFGTIAYCELLDCSRKPDWFCADGERRDDQ